MNTLLKLQPHLTLKKVLMTTLLAIALPAASMAYADHSDNAGPRCEQGDKAPRGGFGMPPYLHGLNLSSTQEDQIFALFYAQVPAMRNQQKQHQQLMEQLRATTQADKFDDAKVQQKVQQLTDDLAKLEKEKALSWAQQDAKVYALLSPEQRKKARDFKMPEPKFGGDARPYRDDGDNNRPANFKPSHHRLESSNRESRNM